MLQNQRYSLTIIHPLPIPQMLTQHLARIRRCTRQREYNKKLRLALRRSTVYPGKPLFVEREELSPAGKAAPDSPLDTHSVYSQTSYQKKRQIWQHVSNRSRESSALSLSLPCI